MKITQSTPWISVLIMLGAIALSIALSLLQLASPRALPTDAPEDEFSAGRALQYTQAMEVGPHWTGSSGNARIRDYLVEQLGAIGLDVEVQPADVVQPDYLVAAHVENVVARLPGSEGSQAILFVVHYDSVASGPGGSYHAFNASLIETARTLAADPQYKNDILFLFTDGEEWGYLGAKAFREENAWMSKVALVFEGIPRGNGGPIFLGTTSDQNDWLMNEFIKALPYPLVHSFARDAYAQIPGGDFEELEKAGKPGMLITWEKSQVTYHAATDSLESLDANSIQHLGSYFLGIARHFGNLDLNEIPRKDNITFFNLISRLVIHYPNSLVIPLNLLAIAFLVFIFITGLQRGQISSKRIVLGFVAFLLLLIAAQVLATLLWFLIGFSRPAMVGMLAKIPYDADTYSLAFIASSLALFSTSILWLRTRIGIFNLTAGALLWWALFSLVTALTLQGGNYIFLWSLVLGSAALYYQMRETSNQPKDALILSFLASPIFLILIPVFYLVYISLIWITGLPGLVALLTAMPLGLLFPHLDFLMQASSRRSWLVTVFSSISLLLIVVGLVLQRDTTDQPRAVHLVYGLDADSRQAYWFTDNPQNEWAKQVLNTRSEPGHFNTEFYGSDELQETASFVRVPAPVAELSAPDIEVLEDSTSARLRTLKLRIISSRGANMFNVFAGPETTILSASLNGKEFYDGEGAFAFPYWGAAQEGIELTITVPTSTSVKLTVSDQTAGFPILDGVSITPRATGWIIPPSGAYYFSDSTWVRKSFTFEK